MPDDELAYLLKRYAEGTCTEDERILVEELFEKYKAQKGQLPMEQAYKDILYERIIQQLQENGEQIDGNVERISVRKWVMAASIAFAFFAVGIVWLKLHKAPGNNTNNTVATTINDLAPGNNKATLTLANGSVIALNGDKTGLLARQGAVKILNVANGELKYNAASETAAGVMLNTISTPLGGQYKVVLPDGTQVRLNAGSSLQFPVAFVGKERNVTLTGEAYFEVAKNKMMPFKVAVNNMTVEVLGTHFNIMAYTNEPAAKTTLLEGSVKISTAHSSGILRPNELGSIATGTDQLQVLPADIEKEMAWRNNIFWFDNADIHTVMKQLARWYDVKINYEGISEKTFTGTLPRNMAASKVLKILEQTGGVHFRITDGAITVLP